MNVRLDTLNLAEYLANSYEGGKSPTSQQQVASFASFMKDFTPQKAPDLQKTSSLQPASGIKIDLAPKAEASPITQNSDPKKTESDNISAETQASENNNESQEIDAIAIPQIQEEDSTIEQAPEAISTIAPATIDVETPSLETNKELGTLAEAKNDAQQQDAPQAVLLDTKVENNHSDLQTDTEAKVDAKEVPTPTIQQANVAAKNSIVASDHTEDKAQATTDRKEAAPVVEVKHEAQTIKQGIIEVEKQNIEAAIHIEKREIQESQAPEAFISAPKQDVAGIQDTKTQAIATTAKIPDVETESSNTNLMQEGDEQEASLAKTEIQIEQKAPEARSIFVSETMHAKPTANIHSTDATPSTKQIFSQVTDHVKNIVSNYNAAKGESITTINLEPGNLGQVSIQIISKENNTEIRLMAKEPETHRLLQEGWKDLVKELETVSSGKDASLSFSLSQGNGDHHNAKNMLDFFSQMAESNNGQKPLAPVRNSVYAIAGGAAAGIYNPAAGQVDLAL